MAKSRSDLYFSSFKKYALFAIPNESKLSSSFSLKHSLGVVQFCQPSMHGDTTNGIGKAFELVINKDFSLRQGNGYLAFIPVMPLQAAIKAKGTLDLVYVCDSNQFYSWFGFSPLVFYRSDKAYISCPSRFLLFWFTSTAYHLMQKRD